MTWKDAASIVAITALGVGGALILVDRTNDPTVTVQVFDQTGTPVAGIPVTLQTAPDGVAVWSGITGNDGKTEAATVDDGWQIQSGVTSPNEPGVVRWSVPITVDGDATLGREVVVIR